MIIPLQSALRPETSGLYLAMYAHLVGIDECSIYGVDGVSHCENCSTIWQKRERDMLIHYLCEAQQEIEQITCCPLSPHWFSAEVP